MTDEERVELIRLCSHSEPRPAAGGPGGRGPPVLFYFCRKLSGLCLMTDRRVGACFHRADGPAYRELKP